MCFYMLSAYPSERQGMIKQLTRNQNTQKKFSKVHFEVSEKGKEREREREIEEERERETEKESETTKAEG